MRRNLLLGQGLYYLASGLWPLVHMRSFEAVTGPKVDRWLVKTVGSLITVVGASLLVAARNERPSAEALVLGAGTAIAMGLVDTVYAVKGRVSAIYLLDAVPEAALAVALPYQAAQQHQALRACEEMAQGLGLRAHGPTVAAGPRPS